MFVASGLVKFTKETGELRNVWRKNRKKTSEVLEMIEKGRYLDFLASKM